MNTLVRYNPATPALSAANENEAWIVEAAFEELAPTPVFECNDQTTGDQALRAYRESLKRWQPAPAPSTNIIS